jgi:ribosomal protein S3
MEDTKLVTVDDKIYRKYTKKILQDEEIEEIQTTETFEETIIVDPQKMKFILGKRGNTKNKIQKKTNSKILIPGMNLNSNEISSNFHFLIFQFCKEQKFQFQMQN